jgi:hypothetical protein
VTLGQDAAEAIRQAKIVLADPSKAEYHERLQIAVDKLQKQMDWWAEVGAAMRRVDDLTNEGIEP